MMRIVLSTIAVVALVNAAPAFAGTNCFSDSSDACAEKKARPLPKSVEDYLKLRKEIGEDPYGGATLFAFALMVRLQDKDLGDKLLVLAVDKRKLGKGKTYKGYALRSSSRYLVRQIDKHPYCIRAHAVGSNPDNNYKLDPEQVALRFRQQSKVVGSVKRGRFKVFLCSSGTSSCRPITLRRNNRGLWKAAEFSSVAVGCRKPRAVVEKQNDDEL